MILLSVVCINYSYYAIYMKYECSQEERVIITQTFEDWMVCTGISMVEIFAVYIPTAEMFVVGPG